MKAGVAALRSAWIQGEPAVLPSLLRLPMSAMVATSALAGYLAADGIPRLAEAGGLALGIFLLAGGCSALNQVQERAEDALMERTRRRPLPSGRLSPGAALALAAILIAGGLVLLGWLEYPVAGWGLGAVLLYNGIYTPLKKRTPFALLAGALCGALPPLIGWCAAAGSPADPRITGLAALFMIWQVPHTWALGARHPEDSCDGPFNSLFRHLDRCRFDRLHRLWLLTLVIATLNLPAFGTLHTPAAHLVCLGLCGGLLLVVFTNVRGAKRRSVGLILYMALLICLVVGDNLPF